MFRHYRRQYETAQKQSDGTCFASLSRKLRDAKACRHHQRDRVAGKNGSTFPVKSKAEYRWGYRKIRSTPSCQNACAFSISRNLSSADSSFRLYNHLDGLDIIDHRQNIGLDAEIGE